MQLDQHELARIRAQPTLEARVTEAIRLIKPDKLKIEELAELVGTGRCSVESTRTQISQKLRKLGFGRHDDERFFLASFEQLRLRLGGYGGNLYEAANYWPNFRASYHDLRDNIKLPLRIGYDEARFLGIVWGDGYVQRRGRRHPTIQLNGTTRDFDFYTLIVQPELKKIFNKEANVMKIMKAKPYPRLVITSAAITSWLIHDMGFPLCPDELHLPWKALPGDEQRCGFLSGILASMANLYLNWNAVRLSLRDYRQHFLLELDSLANQLGYEPRWDSHQSRLVFESREAAKMLKHGLIVRQDHINFFMTKCREKV